MGFKTGFFGHFIEQWSQFLRPGDNWYEFRFVLFEVEWDRILGAVEMTVVLFGLGGRVRYTYAITEEAGRMNEMIDLIDKGEIVAYPNNREDLIDKIEGLEADLGDAVEVAYNHGAEEWVKLNYPKTYERLSE